MKGVDRADKLLNNYSDPKKTVKRRFQWNFCVQNTKHKQEITYKNYQQVVASSQISEVQNRSDSCSDELQLPGKPKT
jgi:hypothetical protein